MPKILLAVVTCHVKSYASEAQHQTHRNGANPNVQWVRDTWLPEARAKGVDYRFFYGYPALPLDADEVQLDVGDDYYSLVPKVRAVFRWALDQGYDYVLKLDDDVYIEVEETIRRFQPVDYRGLLREGQVARFGTSELTCKYACGPAYWVSRKAMEVIVAGRPDTPYEDRATGYLLAMAGIQLTESQDLQACLCRDCLTAKKGYCQWHVETPEWKERFKQSLGQGPLPAGRPSAVTVNP